MNILALYLKEVHYKKLGNKEVEVKKINFTDKRIVRTLRSLGHNVDWMEYEKNKLKSVKGKYDLVFNLADGLENDNDFQEINILKNIEKLKIPFTGNSSRAIKDCYDKSNIKRRLLKKGVKTPKFQVIKKKNQKIKASLNFPLMIKPLFTDGGVGIDDSSVVYNEKKCKKQINKCLKENNQPVLVEEYVDGRDFCVPVIGEKAFPPVECTFSERVFKNRPKIMTYDVKWAGEKNKDYHYTYFILRDKINRNYSKELSKKILSSAEKAFKIMGCSAYATVDIRVDKNNNIFVIEVNPNCWIDKYSDSFKSAKSRGYSYPKFIEKIMKLSKK
ncbi:ATP-grasp domain-containing protein [Candidatus Woesearchaeota archaeon]|nr:ATP-grasp domain-containing protein [Candidatus Woesearchaeota archaeon]MBW2978532.1 ATP-grasp domain-containing protein [Candidatus Woesearchaeota archaeon]